MRAKATVAPSTRTIAHNTRLGVRSSTASATAPRSRSTASLRFWSSVSPASESRSAGTSVNTSRSATLMKTTPCSSARRHRTGLIVVDELIKPCDGRGCTLGRTTGEHAGPQDRDGSVGVDERRLRTGRQRFGEALLIVIFRLCLDLGRRAQTQKHSQQ